MTAQLKSELRKLLTVRSTYILIVAAMVVATLLTYFATNANVYQYEEATCESTGEVLYGRDVYDPRLETASPEEVCGGEVTIREKKDTSILEKERLLFNLQETVPIVVIFATIVLILLMAHEFRHNTINYTLTISNSRSRVLAAKFIVGTVFTVLVTLAGIALTAGVTYAAVSMKGLQLPPQDYDWLYVVVRHLGYALGSSLLFLGIAALIRNLTAAIAAALILPILNGIGIFLLSSRNIAPTKVLPFSALDRLGAVAMDLASENTGDVVEFFGDIPQASVPMALAVFGAYFVVLWVVSWYLFLRRDAS